MKAESFSSSSMANEIEVVLYKDPNQPVEARVRDLLSRMTLAEKAGQMTQIERSVASSSALTGRFIGSVLNGGGSAPRERSSAEEWADMVDEMQRWALASRLGVPIIYGTDAVHGNSNLYGATIFPHNVGLGATRSAASPSDSSTRYFKFLSSFCYPFGTKSIRFQRWRSRTKDWRGHGFGSQSKRHPLDFCPLCGRKLNYHVGLN